MSNDVTSNLTSMSNAFWISLRKIDIIMRHNGIF